VVITTSALSSYFDDFIEWKKQKGIDIELVTVESIYSNYTGDLISGINDNAGKIRQFLSDAYDNGLEYALLGGTISVVPARYGWGNNTSIQAAYEIPTDLYFSDFDGDWNIDADSRYGEPNHDDVDYGAEIFVGRLLCTTGSQIQNWTNKLILYEQNPGNGSTSYFRKAFYTQSDQLQQENQATDIANRFGTTFTSNVIFQEEYNGVPNYNSAESPQFPKGSDVVNEMNSGYGFISWFNHGNPANVGVASKGINSCGGNDYKKVTITDNYNGWCQYPENGNGLDNLSNSTKPFVLYTLACETTPFDTWESIAPSDNLGAQITNLPSKGGPIFMVNTRYGWVSSSFDLQRSFTNIIAGGTSKLGVAEATSKGTSGDHYVWLSHNLVGCPETEIWTDTPSLFTNAYAKKCGGNVTVNTGGATYCTVCVMSSNDGGASYWNVDESSSSEKIFYNVSEPFVITITKHNYIPKIIQSSGISLTQFNFQLQVSPLSTNDYGEPKACPNTDYVFYFDNYGAECYGYDFFWTVPSTWTINYTYRSTISINTNDDPANYIYVDFKNCCNEDDYASLYFVDGSPCGGYFLTITPNPANGETTVSIEPSAGAESFDENTEWDLEIYGASQNLQEKKPKQKTAPQNCKPPGGKRVFTLFARCLMMKY
jgi:hypothetical protein